MRDVKDRESQNRRKARKFARAAKRSAFWRDAPYALRDRPRPGRGAR
jgi:hypothetical protein